jgi:ABC-type transporter Mla subunit MlaD
VNSRLLLEIRRSLRPFIMFLILAVLGVVSFAGIFRNLGVKVGVVSKSELEGNKAILTLQIEDKWGPVYKNAKMRIRPVTPLQDLFVNITDRGDASVGEATKDDIISAEQTVTPVDVSRVLNTFNADTRERMTMLLTNLEEGLSEEGGRKLRESFASLAPFLKVAERTTETLARRDRNVRRLVHNFGTLSEALAKKDKELNEFVTEGNATLGELARNDERFGATFTSIARLMPVMRSSFASLRGLSGELDPALRSLEPVTDELEDGLKALETFGKDSRPALRALRPAVTDLRTMARQLSPTSASLATAFQRLSEQAPGLDRMTNQIDTCMGSITRFFHNTLSVFKFEDGNGAFPRAETTVDIDSSSQVAGLNSKRRPNCADSLGGVGPVQERK